MASLYLPAPTRSGNKIGSIGGANTTSNDNTTAIVSQTSTTTTTTKTTTSPTKKNKVPSYTERCNAALRFSKLSPEERKLPINKKSMFVPRSTADFDDGGSFPEIHVSVFFICTTYYLYVC